MQAEQRGQVRPLATGTRLVYYNHERSQEVEATVKEAGFIMLWVIDQEESDHREHLIGYVDVVKIVE